MHSTNDTLIILVKLKTTVRKMVVQINMYDYQINLKINEGKESTLFDSVL